MGVDVSDTLKPVGNVTATVGMKALTAASPALDKLDFGRRVITSLLKEVGDEVRVWRGNADRGKEMEGTSDYAKFQGKGGFSWSDFTDQISKEGGIGGGEFFANVKNPYVNQLLGLAADVFLDPTTYVSGPGGITKTAVGRGAVAGSEKVAIKIATAEADRVAQAFAKKLAQEALDEAVRLGDNVAASAAKKALADADRLAKQAEKYLASQAAPRTLGRANSQALADRVLGIRDDAQKTIDEITARLQNAPGPNPIAVPATAAEAADLASVAGRGMPLDFDLTDAQRLFDARKTVEVLTDDVIKDIASKGLPGLSGSIVDIVRGVRTPAQELLGVRGGLRFYNPLEVFGVGPRRLNIVGTERITNVAGKLIAESRLGLGRSKFGASVLNKITPSGEGGLFGSEDILDMRVKLRAGTLPADEAAEATRLLALDNAYRAAVSNERKVAAATLKNANLQKFDKATLDSVIPYLQGVQNPATLVGIQKEAFDSVKNLLDDFYKYANEASGGAGFVPPLRQNYFPQMQSEEALRWASKNPKQAEKLAQALGVDRTWFVGNFRARNLAVDDMWFGTKLKASDLNVQRLNQIAKDSGLIKFNYFDDDVNRVLAKYANTHAQFSALQKSIGQLPEVAPNMFQRLEDGVQAIKFVPTGRPPALPLYQQMGAGFLNLTELEKVRPQELQAMLAQVKNLVKKIDAPTVVKADFEQEILDLVDFVDQLGVGTGMIGTQGVSPALLTTLKDESIKLAQLIDMEARGLSQALGAIPDSKWSEAVNVVNNGFIQLNAVTAPNIAAKAEIQQMFTNIKRLSDPSFKSAAAAYIKDYNTFFKGYVTLRPGFAVRNLYSNFFQIVGAGAEARNINQGRLLYKNVQKGLDQGLSPRAIATKLVNDGKIINVADAQKVNAIQSLVDAINYSGATGFGQYGEVADALGVSGRGALRLGAPKNSASRYIGAGIDKFQDFNQSLEQSSRFILHWDGVKQGLSPQEAAARTQKYLIDYNDLSKADALIKQVIPFWMFMSHNAPLQMQMMWTNPKAYQFYNNARRQLEDTRTEEEGGMIIPSYEKDRGTFATKEEGFGSLLPGNVIRPGLPFEGGGDTVISDLIKDPMKQLSGVSPLFRAPVEAFLRGDSGKKFFTEGAVVPKEYADMPGTMKLLYLAQELGAPTSPLKSIVAATPARRNELLQLILGLKSDPEDPLTQEIAAVLQWGGLPLGTIRTEQSMRELQSRIYDLGDAIDNQKTATKRGTQQEIQDLENAPVVEGNTEDPWGVLNP